MSSGCGHMLCENSFVGSKKQQTRFMGVKGLTQIYTEDETQQHIHWILKEAKRRIEKEDDDNDEDFDQINVIILFHFEFDIDDDNDRRLWNRNG